MNFTDSLLPVAWYVGAWAIFIPVFFLVCRQAPWKTLRNPQLLNVWLGALVALALMWQLRAGVRPGLDLHFIGATALTLMVGPQLAILGLVIVLLAVSFNAWWMHDLLTWQAFALNALALVVVPVVMAQGILRAVEKYLPAHFFIYIFCASFISAGLVVLASGVFITLVLWLGDAYPMQLLLREFLPFFLLQGFAEAWLTGAVITLMVVYRPLWVVSFSDRRYLFNK